MKRLLIILALGALAPGSNAQKRQVKILTPYGKMVVTLSDETPRYRDNFIKLVKKRFYDGLLFHRVIKDFMIQGGDPKSRNAEAGVPLGAGGVGYTLPAHFSDDLYHRKGALAAARQGDRVNPEKASSGCQFYLVVGRKYTPNELSFMARRSGHAFTTQQRKAYETVGGTPFLDGSYTVFGQVTEGLQVLDKIAVVPTDGRDRPTTDVPMKIRLVHKFLFF